MSDIPRVRHNQVRFRKIFKDQTGASENPPDLHRLPFRRSTNEEYSFENGRILLNGVDVLSLIEGNESDVSLLAGMAGAIDEYRKTVWSRYGTHWRDFNGQTQGLLEKLLNKLTHVYEEMTGGIRVQMHGGRLWINDIDPKVVLALFMSNPSEERRRYLESIKTKLALILEGKVGKSHSNGILAETKRLFNQIHKALENSPSSHPTPLLAVVGNLDR